MNKLISFSSVSKDKLEGNKVYWGGPANYGGLIWGAHHNKFSFDFTNISNISKSDFAKLSKFTDYIVPNFIKDTATFKITHKKGIRVIKLLTPSFSINKPKLLNTKISNNYVVISPIINEFNLNFYKYVFLAKPKAIFLDIFNNDNFKFSKEEIDLFNGILELNKYYSGRLFIKLSENEAKTLLKKVKIDSRIYLLITCGKNGAKILKNNKIICKVNGLKQKVVSALGAGDVFLYSFAMFYKKYSSLEKSLKEANKIAAESTKYKTIEEFYDKMKERII